MANLRISRSGIGGSLGSGLVSFSKAGVMVGHTPGLSFIGMKATLLHYDKMVLAAFNKQIRKAGTQIGRVVVAEAKRIIPYRENELARFGLDQIKTRDANKILGKGWRKALRKKKPHARDTIRYEWDDSTKTVTIGSNWFVSRFLELGTINARPHQWLTPAVNNKIDEINEINHKAFAGQL